jgi:20S proteasome alpha/beta subunit
MRDRCDSQKKKFVAALTSHGTVLHAARAAGISRQTAYRWRDDDREFASLWDEAIENAVDVVESSLYRKAVSGDTVAMIFYLKAHRPIYRDRMNIDLKQVYSEVEERMAQLGITPDMPARARPILTNGEITPMPGSRSRGE